MMPSSAANANNADIFEQYKDILYELYMRQNKTLKAVSQYMRGNFGVDGTDRQYKSRFKNWGWDNKKLRREDYKAMFVVLKFLGGNVKFGTPTHDSNIERILSEDAINKEIRRRQVGDLPSLEESFQTLAKHPARLIAASGATTIYPGYPEPPADRGDFEYIDLGTGDTHLGGTVGPESDDGVSVAGSDPLADSNDSDSDTDRDRLARMRNQNTTTHVPPGSSWQPSQHVSQVWSTPQRWIYEAEIFSIVIPHPTSTLVRSETWPMLAPDGRSDQSRNTHDERRVWKMIVRYPEGGPDAFLKDTDQHATDTGMLDSNLERQLRSTYEADVDGLHKRTVVEHASYYIAQCLKAQDSCEPADSPARRQARHRYADMLMSYNPYTLTQILSVIVILASHDKVDLLAAYLQDCHNVAEDYNVPYDPYLWTTIRQAIAKHGPGDEQDGSPPSSSQSPGYASRLQSRHRQRKEQFERLLRYLLEHQQESSLTYTLINMQYAWCLVDDGSYTECISILLECSERVRTQLGERHIIRINCLVLTARLYERQNNLEMSIIYLKEAIFKLLPTTNILQAYRHRLYSRLAELWAQQNHLNIARQLYKIVVDFRISRFGYAARQTWSVVNSYHEILRKMNRTSEAEELLRRATAGWEDTPREEASTASHFTSYSPLHSANH